MNFFFIFGDISSDHKSDNWSDPDYVRPNLGSSGL